MTVSDLKFELERLERDGHGEKEIYAVSDYGDHCHTQQLIEVEFPTVVSPRKSAYSETGLALPSDSTEGTEEEVVVLAEYY